MAKYHSKQFFDSEHDLGKILNDVIDAYKTYPFEALEKEKIRIQGQCLMKKLNISGDFDDYIVGKNKNV